jgi:hypothetical protein
MRTVRTPNDGGDRPLPPGGDSGIVRRIAEGKAVAVPFFRDPFTA